MPKDGLQKASNCWKELGTAKRFKSFKLSDAGFLKIA